MSGRRRNRPALPPLANLKKGLFINGGHGSGKTLFLLMYATQIVLRALEAVVYFDLKGDVFAMRWLEAAAARRGIPFKFFTIDPRFVGRVLSLLNDAAFTELDASERANLLVQGCGLDHGEGHGPAYYSGMARWLARALLERYPHIRSAYEMRQILARPRTRRLLGMTRRDYENASALIDACDLLACCIMCNILPSMPVTSELIAGSITIDEMLTRAGVYYFHLPSSLNPRLAKIVCWLVTRLLFMRAGILTAGRVHTHICVDEMQEVLQRLWLTPARQMRSRQQSLAIAMQQMGDLAAADVDLLDTFLGNLSTRVAMSIRDTAGALFWEHAGGQKIYRLKSSGRASGSTATGRTESQSEGQSERQGPRLDADLRNKLNASGGRLAIIDSVPAAGYWRHQQPVIVEVPRMCTVEEYQRIEALGWPTSDPLGARGVDLAHLLPPIQLGHGPDDDEDDGPDEPPPPHPPQPQQLGAAPARKRRKRRGPDPEEEQRLLRELDEQMRRGRETRGE